MMATWRRVPFLEAAEDVSAGNVKTLESEVLASGRFPVVDQGQNFIAGYVDDESRVCRTEPPVIIFGDHTRCFKYVDFSFCMGADGTKVLRASTEFDTKFLYHYLKQVDLPEAGYSRHFKFLKDIEIPLPPLAEQKRIAAILDAAEALREKRRHASLCLDRLASTLLATVRGVPMTIDSALESGVLRLHKDGNHGSEYPRAEDFGVDGIPFVSAAALTSTGEIDDSKTQRLNPEKARRLRHGWIESGDVLLAHNASVGKVALYFGEYEKAIVGTSLTVFRPDTSRITSETLFFALRSEHFQRQLQKNMSQTTRNQVPITAQRRLTFELPDTEDQQLLTRFANIVRKLASSHSTAGSFHEKLNSTISQQAFGGRL